MSRGEVQNFPLAPHQKAACRRARLKEFLNFSHFGKAFPFSQRQASCFLCITPHFCTDLLQAKKSWKPCYKRSFTQFPQGFPQAPHTSGWKNPRLSVFGNVAFLKGFSSHLASHFSLFWHFSSHNDKKWYFLFFVLCRLCGQKPPNPCHALLSAVLPYVCA